MREAEEYREIRIGVVLPYFGKLPNYFPLFLESCRWNPSIDWLLYTDDDTHYAYPQNVKVYKCSFESFRQRLQKVFDFPVCLQTPYKLCDFKPSYGDALKEDLAEYDFWGHCDCDLVFGNIRKFITSEITDKYDRINNCGHLILYRNVPEVNRYYRTQKHLDYQKVFSDEKSYAFDEWPGISQFWRQDGKPCYGKLCYDDIIPGTENFQPTQLIPGGFIGPYHDQPCEAAHFRKMKNIVYSFQNGTLQRCYVRDGRLYQEEVLYVHLQKRKMQMDEELKTGQLHHFLIVPNRFAVFEPPTVEALTILAPEQQKHKNIIGEIRRIATFVVYELRGLGKPDFKARSVIFSLLSQKKDRV